MFRKGDKVARFSPYGGLTQGIIQYVRKEEVVDVKNKMIYYTYSLQLEHGCYPADDCIKIKTFLTDEEVKAHVNRLSTFNASLPGNIGKIVQSHRKKTK